MKQGTELIAKQAFRDGVIDMSKQAQQKIEAMTIEQICEAFEMTNGMHGDHVPMVRGWLMDALEARNPAAFDAWTDSDPSFANTPSHFFK